MWATCDNIFMFGKSSKRYVRTSYIPNIDTEVHDERAACNVELPVRPPLDFGNGGNSLYHMGVPDLGG